MSSGSGIKISDDIKETYNKIKTKKDQGTYAVLKFNDKQDGLVEDGDERFVAGLSYNDLMGLLPSNDVRYIFFDFPYITKNSDAKSSKLLCISWHPQGSSVKQKMLCASTFSALKAACKIGANESLEGDDVDDVSVDIILKKIGGKSAC